MDSNELNTILAEHKKWVQDEGGKRAYLRGADLHGAVGNMRELRSMQIETYPVTYTASHMQIGCQRHTLEEWWSFDDEKIKGMDARALEWWRKWRPLLQQIIETAPAT